MIWSEVGAEYRRLFERVGAKAPLPVLAPSFAAVNA